MESNEVLEIEFELGDGSKHKMSVKEIDIYDWETIEKGTKGLICLVNGQQMLVEIKNADEEGVSFNIIGSKHSYFYDENVIDCLLVETK